jgi:hypothetical protein
MHQTAVIGGGGSGMAGERDDALSVVVHLWLRAATARNQQKCRFLAL